MIIGIASESKFNPVSASNFCTPNDKRLRQRHWDGYERAMQTGRSRYGEGDVLAVPAIRKDGRQVSIEFTVVLLRDGRGELVGIAALLRDVTKRFEEMRTLKRQLGAAAAGSGHEQPHGLLIRASLIALL